MSDKNPKTIKYTLTPKFPRMIHGADYNPEQWLSYPEILEKDVELMKKAHMNSVSVGIFSWANLEPEEGVYDFDWLEKIIDKLYEKGIYTVLATPSGAKPLWMSEKYEEIRRVSRDGRREKKRREGKSLLHITLLPHEGEANRHKACRKIFFSPGSDTLAYLK